MKLKTILSSSESVRTNWIMAQNDEERGQRKTTSKSTDGRQTDRTETSTFKESIRSCKVGEVKVGEVEISGNLKQKTRASMGR